MMEGAAILDIEDYHQPQYAAFGARFIAMLVDVIILFFLVFSFMGGLIAAPFEFLSTLTQSEGPGIVMDLAIGLFYLASPILGLLYRAFFESSKFQGTPGKIMMRIIVVDGQGQRISFQRSLGRNAAKYLSGIILYFGYIMAAFNDKSQALHDTLAGTYVIKKP